MFKNPKIEIYFWNGSVRSSMDQAHSETYTPIENYSLTNQQFKFLEIVLRAYSN